MFSPIGRKIITPSEIAEEFNMPVATVRAHMKKGEYGVPFYSGANRLLGVLKTENDFREMKRATTCSPLQKLVVTTIAPVDCLYSQNAQTAFLFYYYDDATFLVTEKYNVIKNPLFEFFNIEDKVVYASKVGNETLFPDIKVTPDCDMKELKQHYKYSEVKDALDDIEVKTGIRIDDYKHNHLEIHNLSGANAVHIFTKENRSFFEFSSRLLWWTEVEGGFWDKVVQEYLDPVVFQDLLSY